MNPAESGQAVFPDPGWVWIHAYTAGHRVLLLECSNGSRASFAGTRAFHLGHRMEFARFSVGDRDAIALLAELHGLSVEDINSQEVFSFHTEDGVIYWIWAAAANLNADFETTLRAILDAPLWDGGPPLGGLKTRLHDTRST